MKISKKIDYKNGGFSLLELVVVVAGLAILSSLSIPNILSRVKLNKVEEAKALMNSYALDCLAKYRISTQSIDDFLKDAVPDELDNERLSTLQYQIDGDKKKCANVAIKPLNDNEKDLFAFDFSMLPDKDGLMRIRKTGTPSDNKFFENSCKNWAGKNCGASAEQKAKWALEAAVAKAKAECESAHNTWLNAKNSGQFKAWDSTNESCTRPVFAYKGRPVNSYEAMLAMEKAEMGEDCINWRESLVASNHISPNGNPETIAACDGKEWWFHSGEKPFTSQIAWNEFDNKSKIQACNKNREDARLGGYAGEYLHTPDGPSPCGTVTYLCDKKEYPSLDAYRNTSCGAPPADPPPDPTPPHCASFTPHRRCQGTTYVTRSGEEIENHHLCKCK